jgi:hypothetical protein
LKVIQILVDFNYDLAREYIIRRLFIPYCAFMFCYFVFMNYIYESHDNNPVSKQLFYPFLALNVIGATYFMANEIKQLRTEGFEYLISVWNYIDLIPPFGIYLISLLLLIDQLSSFELSLSIVRTILSLTTFFMWFKFLYFLRIFKSTGYLIRMIFEVIKDMRNFFLVLLITIAAFGDSFLRISLAN